MLRQAGLVASAAILFSAGVAEAQDLGEGRRVQSTVKVESVAVGDRPNHVLGVVEFTGLTFYANGEIASHRNVATFDLSEGLGSNRGYVVHTFEDGSTSFERYEGAVVADQAGDRHSLEGRFECVGGTGRFQGLAGEGTWTAERYGSLETGSYVVVDFSGSCVVP